MHFWNPDRRGKPHTWDGIRIEQDFFLSLSFFPFFLPLFMAIKKPLHGNKKPDSRSSGNATKRNDKSGQPKFNKRDRQTNGKKNDDPKELSNTKLKKREYHKVKYNKKDKDDEEDSDFEIVPTTSGAGQLFGSTAPVNDDNDYNSDSDLEMDMFGNLASTSTSSSIAKQPTTATASTSTTPQPKQAAPAILSQRISMDDTDEDNSDDEEKFIANENVLANRKNKKSGGFQSMGKAKKSS